MCKSTVVVMFCPAGDILMFLVVDINDPHIFAIKNMASATCIKCLCESHAAAVSEGGEIEQCT
jgi:hypothetical protein